MNEGWFIYLRQGSDSADSLIKNSIAGPFETKNIASDYLNSMLHSVSSSPANHQEQLKPGESEDWRY